jgi:hypothetical protein
MKTNITILIITSLLYISCQQQKDKEVFITTSFNPDGIFEKTETDTIICSNTLDLKFYNKHFFKPYFYPERFINQRYKSETIAVWADSTQEKKFNSNWTIIYKYDSLSRVIEYGYSGCYICNQFPYNYSISYDKKNRPVRMRRMSVFVKIEADPATEESSEEFFISYDDKDNVIQIQEYSFGKLVEQIKKI